MAKRSVLDHYVVDFRGCWLWTGHVQANGYGQVSTTAYGTRMAHRVSYIVHSGPIPEGKEIDHRCRVRRCVNPAHLEAVTHLVNKQRGARDSRYERECPQMPSRAQVYALSEQPLISPFRGRDAASGSVLQVSDRR